MNSNYFFRVFLFYLVLVEFKVEGNIVLFIVYFID